MNRYAAPICIAVVSMLLLVAPRAAADDTRLPNITEMFEEHRHQVISVQTELAGPVGQMGPLFDDNGPARGEGSGFIVDADGLAITNWHVVAEAQAIEVTTSDGVSHTARLVGADPSTDIALIEIDTDVELQAARLGDSDDITPGQWVVAIGSPFGLEQSVTVGVLSAMGREIGVGPYDDFLQTDASINPGNSGGPLYNLDGEVIGVNTAIIPFGGNLGFSVPIDTVRQILPELRDQGWVVRGYMGAGVQDMSHALAETFGLEPDDGVLIRSVEDGGPADEAGLREGDIVTAVAGEDVDESSGLLAEIARIQPGEQATIDILRDGESNQLRIEVTERPAPEREQVRQTLDPDPIEPGRLGVVLRSVSPELTQRHDLEPGIGVYVDRIEPGSPASGALRQGDIIVRIGEDDVSSPQQVPDLLREQPRDRPIRILLNRDGERHFVAVELTSGDR